jgi:hypothetical protein
VSPLPELKFDLPRMNANEEDLKFRTYEIEVSKTFCQLQRNRSAISITVVTRLLFELSEDSAAPTGNKDISVRTPCNCMVAHTLRDFSISSRVNP